MYTKQAGKKQKLAQGNTMILQRQRENTDMMMRKEKLIRHRKKTTRAGQMIKVEREEQRWKM